MRQIFELSRTLKRYILLTTDSTFLVVALWMAIALRTGEVYFPMTLEKYTVAALWVIASIAIFWLLGLYNSVIRFINHNSISLLFTAVISSAIALVILDWLFKAGFPRTVPAILGITAFILMGGSRMVVKALAQMHSKVQKSKVLVYGAGASGVQLASALQNSFEYTASAFVDDNPKLQGTVIFGVKVHSPSKINQLVEKLEIEKILLAIPSASRAERKRIIDRLEPLGLPVQTVPGTADLVDGRADIDQIQDVKVEDLLGRDPVAPNPSLMSQNITGKCVMVTGAGGSIGSELCRQIITQRPEVLIILDISEYSLYSIDNELNQLAQRIDLRVHIKPFLASVQNAYCLSSIMKAYQVDTVFHAAAYKHVPMVEYNVAEGVQNNVLGTLNCARAAMETGVEKFVLVSTDKAVRPTNIMGTTKRVAELILQAFAKEKKPTSFCMVRFGNVLGSSGSVVPLFRSQIQSGGPVTVTHPDITRYFMTIPEAAQLVIQAGAMGEGGDVFVLDMGESVKINTLAKKMIRLSGLSIRDEDNPFGDIEIRYTGLRPGEKLYEELLIGQNVNGTSHPRIMTANELAMQPTELKSLLKELERACNTLDVALIKELLLSAPTGYSPNSTIEDHLWKKSQLDKQSFVQQSAKIHKL